MFHGQLTLLALLIEDCEVEMRIGEVWVEPHSFSISGNCLILSSQVMKGDSVVKVRDRLVRGEELCDSEIGRSSLSFTRCGAETAKVDICLAMFGI